MCFLGVQYRENEMAMYLFGLRLKMYSRVVCRSVEGMCGVSMQAFCGQKRVFRLMTWDCWWGSFLRNWLRQGSYLEHRKVVKALLSLPISESSLYHFEQEARLTVPSDVQLIESVFGVFPRSSIQQFLRYLSMRRGFVIRNVLLGAFGWAEKEVSLI